MNTLTIAFTGHRPKNLWGYTDRAPYVKLIRAIQTLLPKVVDAHASADACVTFISGGAQGVDQLAFRAVDDMKKRLQKPWTNVVYIPFRRQERRWSEHGMFSQEMYRLMLSQADSVIDVSTRSTSDDPRVQLTDRNSAMLEDADVIFAVCRHDTINAAHGGTQDMLRKARRTHKPIYVLDPETYDVIRYNC